MTDIPTPTPPSPAPTPSFDPDMLKGAMTAFRKRLKVTMLDDVSGLGGGRPTTSGKKSQIVAIRPPTQYPREVWLELARQGKIKDTGGGFYALA